MATTTPNYGWPVPTDTDYVKDGAAAIEALGDAIDATVFGLPAGGLSLISTTTIGTAVSSVAVTGVFSATYDAYKIVVFGGFGSSMGSDLRLTFNNSAGAFYATGGITANINAGTTLNNIVNNSSSGIVVGSVGTTSLLGNFDVVDPFPVSATHVSASSSSFGSGVGKLTTIIGGIDTNVASQTGLTLAPSAGTLTGGKIHIYGYAK